MSDQEFGQSSYIMSLF